MSPKRDFSSKKRNSHIYKERPVLLLLAEGRNVTEKTYFSQFVSTTSCYSIKIVNAGSTTDPQGLYKIVTKAWKEYKLDSRKGDIAFIVLDLDCDDVKANVIQELNLQNKNIKFIVSNPCFELWYLLHFKYSTRQFLDNESLINELRKHISTYSKTKDINKCLSCKIGEAIVNSERLSNYHISEAHLWPSNESNPRTDVHSLMKLILKKKDERGG